MRDPYYVTIRNAASRVRAVAYLLESHNGEILPHLDMSNAWAIVGNILDELGEEIMDLALNMEEDEIGARKKR